MTLSRAFIAIPLPATLSGELAGLQRQLQHELPELRPVAAENLHLTLKFLGDRDQDQLAKIGQFMLSVAGCQAPFSLRLRGLGSFPDDRHPRVVWLGVQPPQPLLTFQHQLARGLAELGGDEEQTLYLPHLTLGRFRRPPADTSALRNQRAVDLGPLPVNSLVLYQSRLTPQGAVHQPLTVAMLKGH